jgi:hypothetical protein
LVVVEEMAGVWMEGHILAVRVEVEVEDFLKLVALPHTPQPPP